VESSCTCSATTRLGLTLKPSKTMEPDTSPRAIMRAAQHLQTLLSVSDYESDSDFSLYSFTDELELLIEDSKDKAGII